MSYITTYYRALMDVLWGYFRAAHVHVGQAHADQPATRRGGGSRWAMPRHPASYPRNRTTLRPRGVVAVPKAVRSSVGAAAVRRSKTTSTPVSRLSRSR